MLKSKVSEIFLFYYHIEICHSFSAQCKNCHMLCAMLYDKAQSSQKAAGKTFTSNDGLVHCDREVYKVGVKSLYMEIRFV